jgi:hypothetical protein
MLYYDAGDGRRAQLDGFPLSSNSSSYGGPRQVQGYDCRTRVEEKKRGCKKRKRITDITTWGSLRAGCVWSVCGAPSRSRNRDRQRCLFSPPLRKARTGSFWLPGREFRPGDRNVIGRSNVPSDPRNGLCKRWLIFSLKDDIVTGGNQ